MDYRQLDSQASQESANGNDDISGLVGDRTGTQQRFLRSLASIRRPTPLQSERIKWLKVIGVLLVVIFIVSIVIAASVNKHQNKPQSQTSQMNVTIEGKSNLMEGEKSNFTCRVMGGKSPYTISLNASVESGADKSIIQAYSDGNGFQIDSHGDKSISENDDISFPKHDTIRVTARKGYKNISLLCNVTDSIGLSAQASKVVNVLAPMNVTIEGKSNLTMGETSSFACQVSGGKSPHTISLNRSLYGSHSSITGVTRETINVTATMSYKNITVFCNVTDSTGRSTQATKIITVFVGPYPEHIHIWGNDTVKAGSTAAYHCLSGYASPKPQISWKITDQNGQQQPINQTNKAESKNASISSIHILMKESFTSLTISCIVTNNVREANKSFLVTILPKDIPQEETIFGLNRTFMLVSSRSEISKIDLDSPDHNVTKINVTTIKDVIGMEFDYEDQCLFWADIKLDQILTKCFKNKSGNLYNETIILSDQDLGTIEAMAYDQTSKILYFLDAKNASIEMMKIAAKKPTDCHEQMRTKVLQISQVGSKAKPRGLALYPAKGYLFWSDWGTRLSHSLYGYIGRSELDGRNEMIIVNKNRVDKTFVNTPSGLAVDIDKDRLYWVDFSNKQISNSNLDGGDLKQVTMSEIRHPFSITILAENVYWSEKGTKRIFWAQKNKNNASVLTTGNVAPYAIKIYSPLSRSPPTACSSNPCSHLCIARPAHSSKPFSCICPDQMNQDKEDGPCTCPDPGKAPSWKRGRCESHQYQCHDGSECIPKKWICDENKDCSDGSDEDVC